MSQFRDEAELFEKAGAQILGINVDTHYSHLAFAEQMNLNFPLLTDFNRQVIPRYTGYYDLVSGYYREVGKRAVFVIDGNGIISYKWISENSPGALPNIDAVLQAVQAT